MATSREVKFILVGKDKLSGAIRSAHGSVSKFGQSLRSIGGVAKIAFAAVAAAVVAAIAILAKLTRMILKCVAAWSLYMGQIAKVKRLTGMSVKDSSNYVAVMDLLGISQEKAANAAKFLGKNLYAAQTGSKPAIESFKQLGVSIRDSSGRIKKLGPFMWDVRNAFAKLADGAKKTALAQKIFSRGGVEMLKFLSASPKKMREYLKFIKDLGMEMGPKSLKKFQDYIGQQRKMNFAWKALKVQIGSVFAPIVTKAMALITSGMVAASRHMGPVRAGFRAASAVARALYGAARVVWAHFMKAWPSIYPILQSIGRSLSQIWSFLSKILGPIGTAAKKFMEWKGIDIIIWAIVTPFQMLASALAGIVTVARLAADAIRAIPSIPGKVWNYLKPFQHGGVATGPKSGYLALLHGTERITPLGSGANAASTGGGGGGASVVLNNCTLVGSGPDAGRAIAKVLDDYYRRRARGA